MADILTRSPYFIKVEDTTQDSVILDVWINKDTATDPSYTMFSRFNQDFVEFEISTIVDDYFTGSFNGTYESDNILVDYQYTTTGSLGEVVSPMTSSIAFEGYGYYYEGDNPDLSTKGILMTSDVLYTVDGEDIHVPIKSGSRLRNNTQGGVLLDNRSTGNSIGYYTGTVNDGDELKTNTGPIETITVQYLEPNCVDPVRVTFINKYGALEDIWFYGDSKETLSLEQDKFKSKIRSNGSYTVGQHQNKLLRKQGTTSLTLHSNYYPESFNDTFQELMLSTKVWVYYKGQVLPATIESSTFEKKTTRRDKLITYEVNFELAYDLINNIR